VDNEWVNICPGSSWRICVYWEEDTDKMLISLAVCGVMFRKTFYNTVSERVDSVLVYPENRVVDYYTKSFESAHASPKLWR